MHTGNSRGNLRSCFMWFLNRLTGVSGEEYDYWSSHFTNDADCIPASPPERRISPHLSLQPGDHFWTGPWQEGLDWWERHLLAVHHNGRPQLFQFRVRQSYAANKSTGRRGYAIEVIPPAIACKGVADLEEAWIESEMIAERIAQRVSQRDEHESSRDM